jgi:cell division protein FtsB
VETLVITWRELLIVVVLVLAVYIAEVLLLTRLPGKRGLVFGDKTGKARDSEIQSLHAECETLRQHLEKMQGELDALKTAQADSPYSQAIKLAQQGLYAGQISANCGISSSEADLIVALYHTKQT